jgi:hypothetical protein
VKLPELLEQGVAEHAYYDTLRKCVTLPNAPFVHVSTPFLRSMAVLLQEIYCRPGTRPTPPLKAPDQSIRSTWPCRPRTGTARPLLLPASPTRTGPAIQPSAQLNSLLKTGLYI